MSGEPRTDGRGASAPAENESSGAKEVGSTSSLSRSSETTVPPPRDARPSAPLAAEQPVEIFANGTRIAILMCTPLDLADLAWGHLISRELVARDAALCDRGELESRAATHPPVIKVCLSKSRVDVECASVKPGSGLDLGGVIASGCGSGAIFSRDFLFRAPLECEWTVPMTALAALARDMFQAAILHRQTGGMHCAAIVRCAGGRAPASPPYFVAREDVGRHNAVDKVIGRAMLDGIDPRDCALLTSGRIAADMTLKAVVAGIPVVVSRSIPTTTAYEIAVRGGLCLVGRIGSPGPTVYTKPERIL